MAFVTWLVSGFFILLLASFVDKNAANVIYKLKLYVLGLLIMIFTTDKSWKKPADADLIKNCLDIKTKRIILIRHGESEWNEVFNRGFNLSFFSRLFKAIYSELLMFATQDSLFIDSMLSPLGFEQARSLQKIIQDPNTAGDLKTLELLRGDKGTDNSVIVCSNLRRAIATCAFATLGRVEKTKEKIFIMTSLQEISRNIDANAIAGKNSLPDLHVMKKELPSSYDPKLTFNTSLNTGNKPIFGNGLTRLIDFCSWAFSRPEETIIVGAGHSLWIRYFFQTFLPKSSRHPSKTKKLANCGVVACTLQWGISPETGIKVYRIDPDSIVIVHGDFK
eukprot:Pompholyxophrys_punicea_v1_NODE_626_length_1565_cov_21.466225.p1 type:complete len:334 gc:universal NODE_626_length_1565_cov_21.466225:1034-33(-)